MLKDQLPDVMEMLKMSIYAQEKVVLKKMISKILTVPTQLKLSIQLLEVILNQDYHVEKSLYIVMMVYIHCVKNQKFGKDRLKSRLIPQEHTNTVPTYEVNVEEALLHYVT